MTRNFPLPSGERKFDTTLNDNIFIPLFSGSNFRNKDIMYLFWFKDDSAFDETTLTGNTFWMTAKFFNATDGTVIDFTNKNLVTPIPTNPNRVGRPDRPILFYEKGINDINESEDLYYQVIIDRNDFTYQVFRY